MNIHKLLLLSCITLSLTAEKDATEQLFTAIYETNYWQDKDSVSGGGSNLAQTAIIRQELPKLFTSLGIKTLIDAPCGDFYWMQHVDLKNIHYLGIDIVADLIKHNSNKFGSEYRQFMHADLISTILPRVDLVFCRDCLVHLKNEQIFAVIKNLKKSGATYLLTTTFTDLKINQERPTTSYWRPLNLQLAPFNFPKPIAIINEHCTESNGRYADKSLALWRLDDITISE